MNLAKIGVVAALIALSGCAPSDGVDDASNDEFLNREALCIAFSERFRLYEAAEKHWDHANTMLHVLAVAGRPDETLFRERLGTARILAVSQSKEQAADYLVAMCNEKMTRAQFDEAP